MHPCRLTSFFHSCRCGWCFSVLLLLLATHVAAQTSPSRFKVIALAEAGGIHRPFVDAARVWLQKQSADNNFSIDYIEDTDKIDDAFLSQYRVFIQLNYPPYGWKPKAVAAFTRYIEEGRGGWIGFHHATLLGEFMDSAFGHGSLNSRGEFDSRVISQSLPPPPSLWKTPPIL
jgi:hypothetical protein